MTTAMLSSEPAATSAAHTPGAVYDLPGGLSERGTTVGRGPRGRAPDKDLLGGEGEHEGEGAACTCGGAAEGHAEGRQGCGSSPTRVPTGCRRTSHESDDRCLATHRASIDVWSIPLGSGSSKGRVVPGCVTRDARMCEMWCPDVRRVVPGCAARGAGMCDV
eukprot:260941-Chlamydomonas_euryale.AAC.1